jgi:integrase
VLDGHRPHLSVWSDDVGLRGRQSQQGIECVGGTPAAAHLHPVTEQDERHEHSRSVIACFDLWGKERREDTEEVRNQHAQTHQHIHVEVRDQAIVLLAHDGALRREEIVLLRIDDIDWLTHTIKIRAEITKNKMSGIIMLSNPTLTRLKEYIEEDRATLVTTYGAEAQGCIFLSDSHRNSGQRKNRQMLLLLPHLHHRPSG